MQVATKGKLKDFQKLYHESPERIEITDSSGNTVLHLASANRALKIQILII
jgi:ankyrin repeat protein